MQLLLRLFPAYRRLECHADAHSELNTRLLQQLDAAHHRYDALLDVAVDRRRALIAAGVIDPYPPTRDATPVAADLARRMGR